MRANSGRGMRRGRALRFAFFGEKNFSFGIPRILLHLFHSAITKGNDVTFINLLESNFVETMTLFLDVNRECSEYGQPAVLPHLVRGRVNNFAICQFSKQ